MKEIKIQVSPEIAYNSAALEEFLKKEGYFEPFVQIRKRSIDARQKSVKVNLDINLDQKPITLDYQYEYFHSPKKLGKSILIIGAGPAGMFAALRCIELGFKPIIIERGSDVRLRRRDLAAINKDHVVNPESNYCFGEGGAGTYSDGKLYTRSKKRGDIKRILEILVKYGATSEILVDAHPHIGTNKLPMVVTSLREAILNAGGEVHFNEKMTDIILNKNKIAGVELSSGSTIMADALILATGHSARDIFYLLERKKILLEAKEFALGVRIEHQQSFVDQCQYKVVERGLLPAAAYSLVSQTISGNKQRGVFSFCMCPGGFIVPSSTSQAELVVNGMSPSRRDSKYANSGVVVAIQKEDWAEFKSFGHLAALKFQEKIEQEAYTKVISNTGNKITQSMPAQLIKDFQLNKISKTTLDTSYQPGLISMDFREIFPKFIIESLKQGLNDFNNKMKGYENGQIIGIESRTSSPVRIPRDNITLMHPEIEGLFPCGEGAGYAGGIVSAAMDGERCAEAAISYFSK